MSGEPLIENALRAEPLGGFVIVRLSADGIVNVIDHGLGIGPQERDMIFEPFWRKSDTTPGTGLGLAIARELMEKQGGRLWVAETLGGGATFKLAFARPNASIQPPGVGTRSATKEERRFVQIQ